MEAVLKKEIQDLGCDILKVEDGRVIYTGNEATVCRSNLFLRTTERVLIKVGNFHADTFDDLFERTKALPWEDYIPINGKFWVAKASSVKSKLFSPKDIQSIMKKAIVERLKQKYKVDWFGETGSEYPIRVNLMKDEVTIGIDTSGDSLHKRGYRKLSSRAPITETLAAALIMLTPWNKDRQLADPFCGSGTIPIEAALMGAKIAPGMNRSFAAETWSNLIDRKYWYQGIEEANDLVIRDAALHIQAFDIDASMIRAAKENAALAGVGHLIHFQERPLSEFRSNKKYGFIITNPPYGERMEEKEAIPSLYKEMGNVFKELDTWSYFIITAFEEAEKYLGRKADKNRKIYNGMMKTYFYQYLGPKPPKRDKIEKKL